MIAAIKAFLRRRPEKVISSFALINNSSCLQNQHKSSLIFYFHTCLYTFSAAQDIKKLMLYFIIN